MSPVRLLIRNKSQGAIDTELDHDDRKAGPNGFINNFVTPKCQKCDHLQTVIKKLTLDNQNLLYQLGFKEIALKKREAMISHIARDFNQAKEKVKSLQNVSREPKTCEDNFDSSLNNNNNHNISYSPNGAICSFRNSNSGASSQLNNIAQNTNAMNRSQMLNAKLSKPLISAFSHYDSLIPSIYQPQLKLIPSERSTQRDSIHSVSSLKPIQASSNNNSIHTSMNLETNTIQESQRRRRKISNTIIAPNEQCATNVLIAKASPLQKQTFSPSKLTRSSTRTFKSHKAYNFDNLSDIYKTLPQLKSLQLGSERRFLEEQVNQTEEFAERITRESFPVRCQLADEMKDLLRDYAKVLDQSIVLRSALTSVSLINR